MSNKVEPIPMHRTGSATGFAGCASDTLHSVLVMGILNVTPDSFSDGGDLKDPQALKQKAREMIAAGVNIIDVGGESTRPGHQKVSPGEELQRVLPAIKIIREISSDLPISVDTQKAEVAQLALEAGASIINDVSGLSYEKDGQKMASLIKKHGCKIILMRNRPLKEPVADSCKKQFQELIDKCTSLGVDKSQIILDPGLGFGDLASGDYSSLPGGSASANTNLVLSVNDYSLGYPVLIGASRKRFLGEMSGQTDSKKRLVESLSFAVLASHSGASIVRVHDAAETIQALREN